MMGGQDEQTRRSRLRLFGSNRNLSRYPLSSSAFPQLPFCRIRPKIPPLEFPAVNFFLFKEIKAF
jgi:hypothetical protein